jgi:hypothetical protein
LIKIPRSRKSSKRGRTRRKSRRPAAPPGPKPGTHHFSAVPLAVAAPEIGAARMRVFKEVTNKRPLKRAPYRQEQLKAAVLNQYPQWSEHYPTKDELPTPRSRAARAGTTTENAIGCAAKRRTTDRRAAHGNGTAFSAVAPSKRPVSPPIDQYSRVVLPPGPNSWSLNI